MWTVRPLCGQYFTTMWTVIVKKIRKEMSSWRDSASLSHLLGQCLSALPISLRVFLAFPSSNGYVKSIITTLILSYQYFLSMGHNFIRWVVIRYCKLNCKVVDFIKFPSLGCLWMRRSIMPAGIGGKLRQFIVKYKKNYEMVLVCTQCRKVMSCKGRTYTCVKCLMTIDIGAQQDRSDMTYPLW